MNKISCALATFAISISALAESPNFLLRPGYNSIKNDKLVRSIVIENGKQQPVNVAATQAQCDKTDLHFLVQQFETKLPGIALQFYAGFCGSGIADTYEFVDGKIFLLTSVMASERASNKPVGEYDDKSLHFELRFEDKNGLTIKKFDAALIAPDRMQVSLRVAGRSPKLKSFSDTVDKAEVIKEQKK